MPQKIKQLLFDCDNTLVLSEELAFEACADLANKLLSENNVPTRYTGEQLIIDFVGLSFRNMIPALQEKYNFQIPQSKVDEYVAQEEESVIAKLQSKARPCRNSIPILEKLFLSNKYQMAVVSSSALNRIRAALEVVNQSKYFPYENVYSASTSLPTPAGKPSPAVYLFAMADMGVTPEQCVAIEDSKSGATAAVHAGIQCIAYVGSYPTKIKQDQVADTLTMVGCKVVMYDWNELEACLEKMEDMMDEQMNERRKV